MSDAPQRGEQSVTAKAGDPPSAVPTGDEFVHTPAVSTSAGQDSAVTTGYILWTLTHKHSTAQARRWHTPSGFELDLQIWTGVRIEGQEDLCWSQLFATEEALADVALAKKRQLQASGWLEDIDTVAR
jgi:hypothetical protein